MSATITFAELAARSSAAMLNTRRVGDPIEDGTMKAVRKVLSKINALGFVTTDSQMGRTFAPWWRRAVCWKRAPHSDRQRAYICGFVSKTSSGRIFKELDSEDVVVLMGPHRPEHVPFSYGGARLTLTYDGGEPYTANPVTSPPNFVDEWLNTLPELNLADDAEAMRAMEPDVVALFVMDAKWGRKTWLFDVVRKALERAKS
jgi:hypothetical protein